MVCPHDYANFSRLLYSQPHHVPIKLDHKSSEDWLFAVMKKHPQLSLSTPQPTSMSRTTSFNRANANDLLKALTNGK